MEQKDNLFGVLKTLAQYFRFILIACVITGVGSIIISLVLPVYYQASTVFLSASPELLTERGLFGTTTRDPQPFGDNNDNDRLLTIAESDELANYLIDRFNLYEHYDMDSTGLKASHYIKEQFRSLYEVKRTKRDAIQLSMEDETPEMAAAIANAARAKIDEISLMLAKDLQQKQIQTFQNNIKEKNAAVQIISDSLKAVRKRYSIYNTESQSEVLSGLITSRQSRLASYRAKLEQSSTNRGRDTLRTGIVGLEKELENLEDQLNNLNEGMPRVMALEEEYDQAVKQLTYDKERLKQLRAAYSAEVSSIILVESAAVPVIKSRPIRSILVLASVFAVFLFTTLGVLLYDNYKDLDWKGIVKQ
ncbi:MAG: hypothetical protein AAF847_12115 [Bacteroidota bacterium]